MTTNQSNWESRFDEQFTYKDPTRPPHPKPEVCNGLEWGNVKDFIRTLLTEQREEAQEEYKQFILNVLDGVDIADGECNTRAIRLAINSRLI